MTSTPQLLHHSYTQSTTPHGEPAARLLQPRNAVHMRRTDDPISWPPCRSHRSRAKTSERWPARLPCVELARGMRCESARRIQHWWNVTHGTVARWRKALGVDRLNNEGTHRLIQASAVEGGQAKRRRGVTAAERRQRRRTALRLNLAARAGAR